jgi:hypothetical protein
MPTSKLIAFRNTELHDRIAAKAAKDNKSFADTARDLIRFALDATDNRVLPDNVVSFSRFGTRVVDNPNGKGKSVNTVSLRDDPIGQMYDAGQIDDRQYDIGRTVEYHFTKWHGQNPRSNFPSRERITESAVHGVWHKEGEEGKLQLVKPDLRSIPSADEVRQSKEFLRRARDTLGWTAYKLVTDVVYNKKPTLRTPQFGAALDKLAPLCGYATERIAA